MKIKTLYFVCLIACYTLTLKATYILLLIPIEVKSYDKHCCKSIVVLGGRDDYDKVLKALELYHVNDVEMLIFSGLHDKYKDVVVKFGLKNVVFEDTSTSTFENAKYSKILLKNYNDICIVSREVHLFRAEKVFDKQGMNVYPVIANKNSQEMKLKYFLPDLKYFVLNISVLYEYLAVLQYKLQNKI